MSMSKVSPANGPPAKLPEDWTPVTPDTDGFCYLRFFDDETQWQILAFQIGAYPNWRTIMDAGPITSKKAFIRKLDRHGYYHIYSDGVGVSWHKLGFKPGDVLGARAVSDDYCMGAYIMAATAMVSMLFGCMAKWLLVLLVIGVWTLKLNQYTDSCDNHNDFTIQELQALRKDPKAEIFHQVCEPKTGVFAIAISFWSAWTRSIFSQIKMMASVMASLRTGGGCMVIMFFLNMGNVMATPNVDVIGTICATHAGKSANICHTGLSLLHDAIGDQFDSGESLSPMCLDSAESRRDLMEHEMWVTSDPTENLKFDVVRIAYVKAFCPSAPSTDPEWWSAAKHQTYITLKKKREELKDGIKTVGNSEGEESKVKSSTAGQIVDEIINLSTDGFAGAATNALSASRTIMRTAVSAQGHVHNTANNLVETGVEAIRATADEVTKQAADHTKVMAGVVGKTVSIADAVGTFSTDALFASANGVIGVADAVKDATKATINAATDHLNEHARVPAAVLGKTMIFADAVGSLSGDAMSVGTTGAIEIARAVKGAAKATIEAATQQIKEHAGVPAVILDGTVNMIDKVAAKLPSGSSVGEHVGTMSQNTANAAAEVAKAVMNDGVNVASTVATEAVEWRGAIFDTYNAVKRDVKEMVPAVYANTKAGFGHVYNFVESELYSPTTLKDDMAAANEKIRGVSADIGDGALKIGANVATWATSKSAMDWKETIKSAAEALPETVEILTKSAIRPVDVIADHMHIDKTTFTDMVRNLREAVLGESPVKAVTTGVKDLRTGLFGETSLGDTWSWLTATTLNGPPFGGVQINPSVGFLFVVGFALIGMVGVMVLILKAFGITNRNGYDPMNE